MINLAEYIKVHPFTKEAIIRVYEIGLISYETMVYLIKEGQQKGEWA